MILTSLKALFVTGLTETFSQTYPVAEWRNLYCSIEYPIKRVMYPSIWVDVDFDGLVPAGISSEFYTPLSEGVSFPYKIWRFGSEGHSATVSFTIVALSSLERDRIFDELVRIISFGTLDSKRRIFRDVIESNEFIACDMDWDSLAITGKGQSPGTPWGGDEILYEITLNARIEGEFASDNGETGLIPLSSVRITPTPDPLLPILPHG